MLKSDTLIYSMDCEGVKDFVMALKWYLSVGKQRKQKCERLDDMTPWPWSDSQMDTFQVAAGFSQLSKNIPKPFHHVYVQWGQATPRNADREKRRDGGRQREGEGGRGRDARGGGDEK